MLDGPQVLKPCTLRKRTVLPSAGERGHCRGNTLTCGDTGLSAWTPGPFIRQTGPAADFPPGPFIRQTGPAADFPPAPQERPEMQQPCLKAHPLFLHPPDLNSFLQK